MLLENQPLSPSKRPNDRQARRTRARFAESTRRDGLGDGGGTADCRGTACPLNARLLTYLKQPVRTAEATRSRRMVTPTLKALLDTLQQSLRLSVSSRNTLPQEELPHRKGFANGLRGHGTQNLSAQLTCRLDRRIPTSRWQIPRPSVRCLTDTESHSNVVAPASLAAVPATRRRHG